MKKLLTIILCSALSFPAFAAKNTSATVAKHHHHKKVVRKVTTHKTIRQVSPAATLNASGTSSRQPRFYSYSAYAVDVATNQVLVSKNPTSQMSIASITKLMTAMVMLDSGSDLDEYIQISEDDVDHLRNTFSRLRVGMQLRRRDLLLLALMSSENRASYALARTAYPGGIKQFIQKMNAKAKALGMNNTQFYDPTGLTAQNKSTAVDLSKMVKAAYQYNLIREDTTTKGADVVLGPRFTHHYLNSDALVRTNRFQIELSKTGFINEAGHCLVLYAVVDNRPVVMVFLNSSKNGRLADAVTVKNYVDKMQ